MTAPDASANERPVVLITGASSGIGHALARRFAARGWRVWATMRTPSKGEGLRQEARERGWTLSTSTLDVTDDLSVHGAVSELLRETGGRLDLLVNNAGYFGFGALEDVHPDELRAQFETNVVGAHRVTRAVLPSMRARGAGRVVFLGSLSGLVALPMMGPYHASKWALEGLVESLRYELLSFGIRVVLIEPGPFETDLHTNEVLAAAADDAASPYAPLLAAYRHQATRLRRASLPALIDTIERASTVARPRLRWPVGPTAFQVVYLRRMVPDWLYELVVRFAFRIRAR
jgi:NAD(P)-dependent dehydrogenase (short-subunit alcohol dehydrogenase family)